MVCHRLFSVTNCTELNHSQNTYMYISGKDLLNNHIIMTVTIITATKLLVSVVDCLIGLQ